MYKLAALCLFTFVSGISLAQTASDSTFYSLTKALNNPEKVKHLILKDQNLDSLPVAVLSMRNLKELNVEGNNLQQLPGDLGQFPHLEIVNLSQNTGLKLGVVLRQLSNAPELKHLDLSSCQLEYISYRIGRLAQLETLNLSHNKLKKLPSALFYLSRLQTLDCTNNRIEELPPEIQITGQLMELKLSGNPALDLQSSIELLKGIGSLQSLEIGPVNREKLKLEGLTVKNLVVFGGTQQKLGPALRSMSDLETLTLHWFGPTNQDLIWSNLAHIPQLKSLEVKSRNQVEIDLSLGFDSLQSLLVEAKGVAQLKTSKQTSENLTSLKIQVPTYAFSSEEVKSLSRLKRLQKLDLSGCGIAQLPENLNELKALTELRLNNNKLSQLPAIQADLNNLALLELTGNRITEGTLNRLDSILPDCEIQFYGSPYSDLLTKDNKIVPPIPHLEPQPETFTYQPNATTEIETQAGYKFRIPAGSLMDADGKPLKQPVPIEITDYNTAEDIALSGIPMTLGSGENAQSLSSQAMFKIEVPGQNGVSIDPAKPIQVSLPSAASRDGDELFVFDTVAGNWTRPQQDSATPFTLDYETVGFIQQRLNINPPERPSRKTISVNQERLNFKVKRDRNKDSFTVVVKKEPTYRIRRINKKFPEYKVLQQATWVYEGPDAQNRYAQLDSLSRDLRRYYRSRKRTGLFRRNIAKTYKPGYFQDMTLSLNPEGDNFELSLQAMNGETAITLFPEFGSNRHDQEARRTKKLYKKYRNRYEYSRKKWTSLDERIAEEDEKYNEKWERYQESMKAFNATMKSAIEEEYDVSLPDNFDAMDYQVSNSLPVSPFYNPMPVTRRVWASSISLVSLGLINIDKPLPPPPNPNLYVGNFVDSTGKIISPERIILVDERNKNTVALAWNNYLVIPSHHKVSMIATFDNGNAVAIVDKREIRSLPFGNRNAEFPLSIIPSELITREEIRTQLR
ncbi:leucine-rich repeat domain-containing protein [bacterium SCSIO 12741]|nr:leucine-rich repeat domain-containing protein [bacterium SCSIO 12741]